MEDRRLAIVDTLLIAGAPNRIAASLIRVAYGAVGPKSGERVSIMLSQSELGEMANTSRNLTGRTLKEMERKGWISIGYRTLTIIDPDRIKAFGAENN
jgi:CRP/FNR family cyclic AMP-dependent transcriptional regulator